MPRVINEHKQRKESMPRFKLLLVAVAAVFALASMAASTALASGPTLLFKTGGGPTILLKSANATIATELQSEATTLKGEGDLTELTLLQTSVDISGIYSALFTKVKQGTQSCNTKGDPTGEVLLPQNTLLVVYWNTKSGELQAGIVFSVKEFTIECGEAKIVIKGTVLGSLSTTDTGFKEEIKGGLHCSSTFGKPEKTEYTNSKGEVLNTHLEATAAKKTSEACEQVGAAGTEETFKVEAGSSSKEAELMF
jgi:hypothetical protein